MKDRRRVSRDRCPECGRLHLETAQAKFRRQLLRWVPEDQHGRIGTLLNRAHEVGREPADVVLLAFDALEQKLAELGADVGA